LIRLKRSTASDTDTAKSNRWFRLRPRRDLPEFDHILDLYWGGPERRITGLTARIIGVNAIALVMLMVGTLYLGQYQKNLIEAKLETFKAEVELVSAALSEGATEEITIGTDKARILIPTEARLMVRRLSQTMRQHIMLFDHEGRLTADSRKLTGPGGEVQISPLDPPDNSLYTVQILKSMAGFILNLLPDRRILPFYPELNSQNARDYPDADDAIRGQISISVWNNKEGRIFLSAAAPLYKEGQIGGAVLLTREGRDVEEGVGAVWINILKAFVATLIITILLSIYLSGAIASPLRKLANAAESVRRGKAKYTDIPDLSNRNDEIGELSIALREMTQALWDRMDSIEGFAADVAHELKNPLTSLRSAVETAAIVKNTEDREKMLSIIKHDVDRLDRLISDISHASRLDAELSREALERVDLKTVLHYLLDAYKDPLMRKNDDGRFWATSAKAGDILITLDCAMTDDVYVWGLEGRVGQVFENVLSNALSFTPPKGRVDIYVTPQARHVRITVEDQGPGIPASKLETIFERFYSERPEHERYGRHSGLGLSICRQIVTALGGEIFAENITDAAGKITGARFTIILGRA
jgi:two-component system, OmpR family, sensor histidine kinase ChvG